MNKYSTAIVLTLAATTACTRQDKEERELKDRIEDKHEAQAEHLEQQHQAEKEALSEIQKRQEQALENKQQQEDRAVERHQQALKDSIDPLAASQMVAGAVSDITAARCAREQRCGNVGKDKEYLTAETCNAQVSDQLQKEFDDYHCAGGVIAQGVESCRAAIREESCSAPFEKLARFVACREASICNNPSSRL